MHARRQLLIAFSLGPLLHASGIHAQGVAKRPHVGYIGGSANKDTNRSFTDFRDELQRHGYSEGKTVAIDYKGAEGQLDRIPGLVHELVHANVDVLVVTNTVAIRAAQRATQTIPIVMVTVTDPVIAGYAKSLRQPGGNITGIYSLRNELSAKRMEMLKELVPGLSRVAILWDADAPGPRQRFQEYVAGAKTLKLVVQSLEVKAPKPDFDAAFQTARAKQAQALIMVSNPLLGQFSGHVAARAMRTQLPSIGENRQFANAGGLISYGEDLDEQPKVLASIVTRILKGAKPADLPIEQPTKFELVVNLKTAKALGITIPPMVMVQATRVIE